MASEFVARFLPGAMWDSRWEVVEVDDQVIKQRICRLSGESEAQAKKIAAFLNDDATDEERGYLIERYVNSDLMYWGGNSIDAEVGFERKVDHAVRFARHRDAATVLAFVLGGNGRVAEHVWEGSETHRPEAGATGCECADAPWIKEMLAAVHDVGRAVERLNAAVVCTAESGGRAGGTPPAIAEQTNHTHRPEAGATEDRPEAGATEDGKGC